MKKILYITTLILIASTLTFCGGSGSNNDDEIPTPVNKKPGAFTVLTEQITTTSAKINWTAAVDPDGDKVTYTLQQGTFIVDNLIATEYEISNLNPNTTYNGSVTAEDGKGGETEVSYTFKTLQPTGNSGNYTIPENLQNYYKEVDFTLTGNALRDDLKSLVTSTHTNILSYSDAREALKITDLVPNQGTYVFLIYGYDDNNCDNSTTNSTNHRTRNKANFGGGASCEWNREHTYPKSLGTPNLGETGPGADAHHLRGCDVQKNSTRSNIKYAEGSGNAGNSNGGWYPGDEWKGDVARMMMYMYIRYGSQCLPKNVAIGNTTATDPNMVEVLLEWNASDPVSAYEINRNTYLGNANNTYGQGNRNPFIDNPYLATAIWGGTEAENTWK